MTGRSTPPVNALTIGILLHKQFRHIDAERRAGDLEFGVEIGTLRWRNFHGAGGEDDAYGRFAGDCEKFLERRVNSGNRSQALRVRDGRPGGCIGPCRDSRISCVARRTVAGGSGHSVRRRCPARI